MTLTDSSVCAHWKYFKYVARHKYYVYKAGRVTGAPLWRLVIHDWSKFTPAEWFPYVENFYGHKPSHEEDKRLLKQNFRYAFLHHIHRNPHHWEYWVLVKPQKIPDHFVREMVADWCGAGRAISGKWDYDEWYNVNYNRLNFHPDTRKRVEELLHLVAARGLK